MKRSALLWLAFLSATPVLAAQWARVIDDQADFYDGPTKKHHSLQKIPKGTMLQASNYPTEGYHKVRLQDGTIGWVRGSSLLLKGTPGGDTSAAKGYNDAPHPSTQKNPNSAQKTKDKESGDESNLDLPPPIPE